MMRVLAAVLAILGLLAMAPAGHASGSAGGRGAVAHSATQFLMADGAQAPCVDGPPCLFVCAACFPAAAGKAGGPVLPEPETASTTDSLATFDLPWRVYRPPKVG